jgi:hypothetical protein
MGLPHLSRGETAFVLGVPVAWAVLLLFHPSGEGTDIYADLKDNVTEMLVVHVGMVVFIPLMAVAIFLLLRGIESRAAQVSRIALLPFVVFYLTWEALQGIANGLLAEQVNQLPVADQEIGATLIQDFAETPLVRDFGVLSILGAVALVVATIALGIALRNAGAPRLTPWLFGVSGFLITAHPPPFGPTGLALFVITVLYVMRAQSTTDDLGVQPGSA